MPTCQATPKIGTRHGFKDTSPVDENPLPVYRVQRLDPKHHLPEKLTAAECKKLAPTIAKVKALLGNGLTGIDLVRY